VSQALVLEDRGDYDASLSLLEKAQKVAPGNTVVAAMTKETRKRVALAHDKEKQGRVDQLVQDLLETVKAPPVSSPSDGWTSPPLTLWLLNFTVQGNSLGEGEERMLTAGITDQLIQHGRAQVVERALLDQLLEELKLGTSQLADRRTALSLGRILAARVMVSGQLVFAGPETQVSLRLIETETGRVSGAMNESFGSAVPVSMLSEKLSRQLIKKLEALYPLRGRVAEVAGEQVRINIGQKAGVQVGQRFKVLDQDMTLEVVSAEQETSITRITAGEGELTAALRVEAL
jgi:hypothetical protein